MPAENARPRSTLLRTVLASADFSRSRAGAREGPHHRRHPGGRHAARQHRRQALRRGHLSRTSLRRQRHRGERRAQSPARTWWPSIETTTAPRRAVVSIIGDVTRAEAERIAQSPDREPAGRRAGSAAARRSSSRRARRSRWRIRPRRATFTSACRPCARGDPDYFALLVGNYSARRRRLRFAADEGGARKARLCLQRLFLFRAAQARRPVRDRPADQARAGRRCAQGGRTKCWPASSTSGPTEGTGGGEEEPGRRPGAAHRQQRQAARLSFGDRLLRPAA